MRMGLVRRCTVLAMAVTCFGVRAEAQAANWVGSWATSQQRPEPQNSLAPEDMHDATLRQVVHLSVGGSQLRVHLTNAFGAAPLRISAAHIARPVSTASGSIEVATDTALMFGGSAAVTIPAGAEYISDPVTFPATALSDLAISIHLEEAPVVETGHPGSRATSYVVHGDLVSAANLVGAKKVEHWYQIGGVDVVAGAQAAAVVTLGDSITDGHGATTNGNDRWPDVLARRLQGGPATKTVSVLNHGIGGNRLLLDGLGPNALARFDRDVVAQTGVRYVIVFEGVNDLGTLTRDAPASAAEHKALVERIESAYEQMIVRAHAHGIRTIGATITPYGGSDYYHPNAENEADRQAINEWIRDPKHFDAVVDFDKVVRDSARADHLNAAFDSGDHLHPSAVGYKAMGEAIPLTLFSSGR
jgi:lysophospholipase L1-like esterase